MSETTGVAEGLRFDLGADDFTLMGLPARFALDRAELDTRWKTLQRLAHPDRHATAGAAAQRVAMQAAVRINEAYQRLKDPLRRASYLCQLRGAPVQAESNTAMPPDFLQQQMLWRETLDDARCAQDLDPIAAEVRLGLRDALQKCERSLDSLNDPQAAAAYVRQAMFLQKLEREVELRVQSFTNQAQC